MHPTLAKLLSAGPVVTDGAWGTQLQQRGLPIGACPDAWNLTQPEKVEDVARAYVEAGSRVILTNTFGANRFILARHNLADQVVEINRAGVEVSRQAAKKWGLAPSHAAKIPENNDSARCLSPFFQGGGAAVFASMGPSGVMLMMGQVSEEAVQAAFAEQARAMADAGADGIVIETMSDPTEAKLAVVAARATGLPVVACMTFDSGAKKDRTMMGATPEQAAEQLTAAGADAIGGNCGQGIAGMVEVCRRLRAATDRPIWIKANAGLPEMIDGETVYKQTPAEFAAYVPQLIDAGASLIGGCCGTTPEFIRAVVEKLKQ
jgi:methionine synthase I (cobalamin-dependent)